MLSGRQVPGRGAEQPGPRVHGPGAARQGRRPPRQGPGRQPDRARAPGQAESTCRGSAAPARAPVPRRRRESPACARARSATRSAPRRRSAPRARRPCAATSPTTPSTTCARTRAGSRASRSSASTSATTRRGRSPRTCSATPARSTPSSSTDPRYEALSPATRSARRGSSTPTTASCAASTASAGCRSTPPASRPAAGSPSASRCPGNDLVLTIDDDIQRDGRERGRRAPACPGGFVAMNIHDGQLYGIGSSPATTRRSSPSRGCRRRPTRRSSLGGDNGAPLFDRATNGFYPTGSTFKPITALAALDSGNAQPQRDHQRPGRASSSATWCSRTRGTSSTGRSTSAQALKVSSDVFFYTLGGRMNPNAEDEPDGGPLQSWARALGLGKPTGLDVGGEGSGAGPDARAAQRRTTAQHGARLGLRRGGLPGEGRGHRPALVDRRQRQPLGRPGRPAGRPAADGGRLRGHRQRRRHRPPARRQAGCGRWPKGQSGPQAR